MKNLSIQIDSSFQSGLTNKQTVKRQRCPLLTEGVENKNQSIQIIETLVKSKYQQLYLQTKLNKTIYTMDHGIYFLMKTNKTSIQWTPGSQIHRSNQTIIFSKKIIFEQIIKKRIKYA